MWREKYGERKDMAGKDTVGKIWREKIRRAGSKRLGSTWVDGQVTMAQWPSKK